MSLQPKYARKVWEEIYSGSGIDKLPWIYNEFPDQILRKFLSLLPEKSNILDYGCGTGRYSTFFDNAGYRVTSVDISRNALEVYKQMNPSATVIQASSPSRLQSGYFQGIFNWGVFHHIQPGKWGMHLFELERILDDGGVLLLGGFSIKDFEFLNKTRISPYTSLSTYAVDGFLESNLKKTNLHIIDFNYFKFTEAFTGKDRVFCHYFIKK